MCICPFEQLEHGILDNLGVHLELGQHGAFAQVVEHGVGNVAHTALQGQEFAWECRRGDILR